MAVKLRLSGGSLPDQGQTKILSSGTLSLGRGPGNDWVLPDPDRHLSKTHCVLSLEHGRLVLTDVSTNGVHINGARQATARDSRTVLTDGDDFRLGDYLVQVSELQDAARGGVGGGFGGGALDPFDAPIWPGEGGSPLDVDPLDDPLGRPPTPGFSHPLQHRPIGPVRDDPFDVAEERAQRAPDLDDDLFRGTKPVQEWQGPTPSDHADAPKHAFIAPTVLPGADPMSIDFDALIGDLGPAAPAAPPAGAPAGALPGAPRGVAPARPVPPPAGPAADPFGDLDALFEPAATAPASAPAAPVAEAPAPRAMPMPVAGPVPAPVAAPVPPTVGDPFAEPGRPQAAEPRTTAASPAGAGGADGRAVLLAFLEGAGVANPAVAQSDPATTMRLVGEVFRAMTEGLREVLLSRAAIKSDMRVEQTMIRARDNNALKFSVNVDDAVLALLSTQRPGYMAPLAATKEAFADLKSHELAVMAGVQSALHTLLQRFEPAALEKRLSAGRLASVLPGARKARYWESFTEVYGEIAREMDDDFQSLFGREFAKAYSARTKKE